jgi:hypothetical protein
MKEWKQFEDAVADFVQRLDPSAKITRNASIPDKDTGEPRQCDVWVETTFGCHFSVKILISCKRLSRKLSSQHIDSFVGEMRSANANKGVIYSYSGYTKPAIKKCEKLGISACRLYQNQRADLPDAILLYAYCCRSQVSLNLLYHEEIPSKYIIWNDLLDEEINCELGRLPFRDYLIGRIEDVEQTSMREKSLTESFPPPKKDRFDCRDQDGNVLGVEICINWEVYKAEIGAYLINGSYSITDNNFKGSQFLPSINGSGPTPGPGWKLQEKPPRRIKTPGVAVIQHRQEVNEPIREYLGPMPLRQ